MNALSNSGVGNDWFLGCVRENNRKQEVCMGYFHFSLAFICSVPFLRNIVRSDDALDKTVIVVWIFLFVSLSVIAVDFFPSGSEGLAPGLRLEAARVPIESCCPD